MFVQICRKIMKGNVLSVEDKVVQVASILAIENMHISEQFQQELFLVAESKKSSGSAG